MAIATTVVIVPIGVLFFISGLIVNLIQVAKLLWLKLVWIVDWWAGVKLRFVDLRF
ncbi:putative 1-acylglycerol-3-phosphate O-acyltransferase [Helianthus anomalus]